jgi:hypothetical protein
MYVVIPATIHKKMRSVKRKRHTLQRTKRSVACVLNPKALLKCSFKLGLELIFVNVKLNDYSS